jgi:hypothetical protein
MAKKLTSFSWWNTIKSIFKYTAYIIIFFEGISSIMSRIESVDKYQPSEDDKIPTLDRASFNG